MKEFVDMLDINGDTIGIVEKNEAHSKGILHRVVHVWVINSRNQILIQKRASEKDFFPNVWDVSFAGHIRAGESSASAGVREGNEELGLDIEENELKYAFTFLDKLHYKNMNVNEFADVYILKKDINLDNLSLQKEETGDVKFISLSEFFVLCYTNKFLPHYEGYRKLKEYLEK